MIASLPSPAFATVASITISRNLDMILAQRKYCRSMGPDHPKYPKSQKGWSYSKFPAVEPLFSLSWAPDWRVFRKQAWVSVQETKGMLFRIDAFALDADVLPAVWSSKGSSYTGRWLGRGPNCNKSTWSICGAWDWGCKSSFTSNMQYIGGKWSVMVVLTLRVQLYRTFE